MKIVLYTTHCPMCRLLEAKLKDAKVNYETEEDVNKMIKLGFTKVPVLKVNDEILNLPAALKWVEAQKC